MNDDESSHQLKMRKTSPESDQDAPSDDLSHPLEWSSHTIGVARDEAAFFSGWCAARQKFAATLRQHFVGSPMKECEEVFNSLTYIFLRRKSTPAVRSPDSAELPLLHAQPWFCRVLHSLTVPADRGALQFSEEVASEMRQVLQKALLELTKVSDIWTFKKSPADRETVIATLERLQAQGICNVDGADGRELKECTAASAGLIAEQVQKRCRDYAVSYGLVPHISRAFDEFCGVWVDSDVQARVTSIILSCAPDCVSPAKMRVACDKDMFTLSLHRSTLPTSTCDTAEAATGVIADDAALLLCPSFPVHRSRLALLRRTYVHKFAVTAFYERVMACLLRYKAVFHPNGGNWQAAQPHAIFELWTNRCPLSIFLFCSVFGAYSCRPQAGCMHRVLRISHEPQLELSPLLLGVWRRRLSIWQQWIILRQSPGKRNMFRVASF
jgi:hypothetical protein